ncbi:MAG: hypothetical protein M0C28_41710 [Candidatus Moduliflexus flocculans]|nr:hypothetical protein [Candidatus Moduliflexus flocculans]
MGAFVLLIRPGPGIRRRRAQGERGAGRPHLQRGHADAGPQRRGQAPQHRPP